MSVLMILGAATGLGILVGIIRAIWILWRELYRAAREEQDE